MEGKITSIDLTINEDEFRDIYMVLIEAVKKRLKTFSNENEEDRTISYIEIMSYHKLIKNMNKILPDTHHFYENDDDVEELKKQEQKYMELAEKYGYGM